jgi:IS30 family transposase
MPNIGSRAERETRNATIVRLHETGVPKTVIARQLGVSLTVVTSAVTKSRPQEQQEAMSPSVQVLESGRLKWNVDRRTQLGAAIFERVESLLPGIESARELKDLSITNDHLTDAERAAIRDVLEGR